MNKIYIVNLIVIVLVIVGVVAFKFGNLEIFNVSNNDIATTSIEQIATTTSVVVEDVACTMEAKQCSDGSYVGRQGPKCEFKACPTVQKTVPIQKIPVATSVSSADTVKITSPLDDTIVLAGATVNVKVTATGNINSVFISGGDDATVDDISPYEASFKVPVDFLGQFPIVVMGRNLGGVVSSDNVMINVITNATVGPISLFPDENLPMMVGQKYPLSVSSLFSDGVRRDITNMSGTTYRSADWTVVSVDKNGVLTAYNPGATTIEARNGSYRYEIAVQVSAQ